MSSPEIPQRRRVIYLLAIRTGLRRGELAQLRWADLDLHGAFPSVTVRASIAKNGRSTTLALAPDLVTLLESHPEETGDGRVFDSIPILRTFYKDLAAIGVPRELDGRKLDFHALRSSCATLLCQAGVPLATAQRIMRHSTPMLTANVYTHLTLVDHQDAAARVGTLVRPESPGVEAAAKGA